MRFSYRQKHMIDLLFPVSLSFVFTLLAMTVILMATNVYQKTMDESQINYTSQTALSYIREKISQADQNGQIGLTDLEGCDALCLTQQKEGITYHTYIYACDGSLRELFVREGTSFVPADGRKILSVEDFSIEEIRSQLYSFSCTAKGGRQARTVMAVHSSAPDEE